MIAGIAGRELETQVLGRRLTLNLPRKRNRGVAVTAEANFILILRLFDSRPCDGYTGYVGQRRADGDVTRQRRLRRRRVGVMTIRTLDVRVQPGARLGRIMQVRVPPGIMHRELIDLRSQVRSRDAPIVATQAIVFLVFVDQQAFAAAGGVRAMTTTARILRDGVERPISGRRIDQRHV